MKKLDEFSGPFITDIWKFFDSLHFTEDTYEKPKQLFEPRIEFDRKVQIARDFNAHLQKILSYQGNREERLLWEWNSFKELDEKWPHLNIITQVSKEKRFKEMP